MLLQKTTYAAVFTRPVFSRFHIITVPSYHLIPRIMKLLQKGAIYRRYRFIQADYHDSIREGIQDDLNVFLPLFLNPGVVFFNRCLVFFGMNEVHNQCGDPMVNDRDVRWCFFLEFGKRFRRSGEFDDKIQSLERENVFQIICRPDTQGLCIAQTG